jgi:hypothetical protein
LYSPIQAGGLKSIWIEAGSPCGDDLDLRHIFTI